MRAAAQLRAPPRVAGHTAASQAKSSRSAMEMLSAARLFRVSAPYRVSYLRLDQLRDRLDQRPLVEPALDDIRIGAGGDAALAIGRRIQRGHQHDWKMAEAWIGA